MNIIDHCAECVALFARWIKHIGNTRYLGKECFIIKESPIHRMQKDLLALFPKLFIRIAFVIPTEVRILPMRIGCDILPVWCYIDIQIKLFKTVRKLCI